MNIIRRSLVFGVVLAAATISASAATLVGFQQSSGSLAAVNDPPNPASDSATFSQFNQANANAAVATACPGGFVCSTATLIEIDLTLNANASQSVTLSNSGAPSNLGCLTTVNGNSSPCTGSLANLSTGVGVAGAITFVGNDPLGQVFNSTGNPFTVATNTRSGSAYSYLLPSGTSAFSGTSNISLADPDIYDNTNANWLTTIFNTYVGTGASNVTINFSLNAGYSDATNPSGVTAPVNQAAINSGNVTVTYDYQYTETSTSTTPEPATLFLMGTALVGVGLLRKRIKS